MRRLLSFIGVCLECRERYACERGYSVCVPLIPPCRPTSPVRFFLGEALGKIHLSYSY